MPEKMDYPSRVGIVRADSLSLKTTIPVEVVEKLHIQKGDVLRWSVIEDDRKPYAKVIRKRLVETD